MTLIHMMSKTFLRIGDIAACSRHGLLIYQASDILIYCTHLEKSSCSRT